MLSSEEQRRFDEITRRIDQEPAANLATSSVIPVRSATFGLFMVGVTGLTQSDPIVLALVGIVPLLVAITLLAVASTSEPASAPPIGPATGRLGRAVAMLEQLWPLLTTCAMNGCGNRPVHLGWCSEHAPAYDPGPDEYWGDQESDPR